MASQSFFIFSENTWGVLIQSDGCILFPWVQGANWLGLDLGIRRISQRDENHIYPTWNPLKNQLNVSKCRVYNVNMPVPWILLVMLGFPKFAFVFRKKTIVLENAPRTVANLDNRKMQTQRFYSATTQKKWCWPNSFLILAIPFPWIPFLTVF